MEMFLLNILEDKEIKGNDWRILSTVEYYEKLLETDGIWFSFCA